MDATIQALINARHARHLESWQAVALPTAAPRASAIVAPPLPPSAIKKEYAGMAQRQAPNLRVAWQDYTNVGGDGGGGDGGDDDDDDDDGDDDYDDNDNDEEILIQKQAGSPVVQQQPPSSYGGTASSALRTLETRHAIQQNGGGAERDMLLAGGGYVRKDLARAIDNHFVKLHGGRGGTASSGSSVAEAGVASDSTAGYHSSSASTVASSEQMGAPGASPGVAFQAHAEDERARASVFTFHPKINGRSVKMAEQQNKTAAVQPRHPEPPHSSPLKASRSGAHGAVPVEDRLIGRGAVAKERIDRMRQQQSQQQEMADTEAHFMPVTNHKPRRGRVPAGRSDAGAASRARSPGRKWSDRASVNSSRRDDGRSVGGDGASVSSSSSSSSSSRPAGPPGRSAIRGGGGGSGGGGGAGDYYSGGGGDVVSRLYEWDKDREKRLVQERQARVKELSAAHLAYPFQPRLNGDGGGGGGGGHGGGGGGSGGGGRRSGEGTSDSAVAARMYDSVLRPNKAVNVEEGSNFKSKPFWTWHRNRNSALAIKQQSDLKVQENTAIGGGAPGFGSRESRDMSMTPVSEEQLRAQARQRRDVQEKQKAHRREASQIQEASEPEPYSGEAQESEQAWADAAQGVSSPRSESPSSRASSPTCKRVSRANVPGKVPGGGLKGKSGWIRPDTRARLKLRERNNQITQKRIDAAELGRNQVDGGRRGGGVTTKEGGEQRVGGGETEGGSASTEVHDAARTDNLYLDATRRALKRELVRGMIKQQEVVESNIGWRQHGVATATPHHAHHDRTPGTRGAQSTIGPDAAAAAGSTHDRSAPAAAPWLADQGSWQLHNPYHSSPPQLPQQVSPQQRMSIPRDRGPSGVGGGFEHSTQSLLFDDHAHESSQRHHYQQQVNDDDDRTNMSMNAAGW